MSTEKNEKSKVSPSTLKKIKGGRRGRSVVGNTAGGKGKIKGNGSFQRPRDKEK